MTSIFFQEKTSNWGSVTISQSKLEDLSESIDCLQAVADSTMTFLEETDLDNIQNAQFNLTTIYNLNYLLKDYIEILHERINNMITADFKKDRNS